VLISHLGHSTVRLELAGRSILIDPGNFSTAWHGLTGLDLIVVTHQHLDHIDPIRLPALLAANPEAKLMVEPTVAQAHRLPRAQPLAPGTRLVLGEVTLSAVGGRHAVIHRDIPRIGNIGLVVEAPGEPRFFHPGDALDTIPEGVDLAAVPAHGPWCAMKEIIDFARQLGAGQGFLIHDGLINQRGWALSFERLNDMTATVLTDHRDGCPWQPA
jgi:L-ascorbate metabolism protein UlaG (beta-lactamase superfamily)